MITPEEALALLKEKEAGKAERLAKLKAEGYPAYTTSVGWCVDCAWLHQTYGLEW